MKWCNGGRVGLTNKELYSVLPHHSDRVYLENRLNGERRVYARDFQDTAQRENEMGNTST